MKQVVVPPVLRNKLSCVGQRYLVALSKNVDLARVRIAAEDSATWVDRVAPLAPSVPNKWALLDLAIKSTEVDGLFCEFGVFRGETINYIASKVTRTVHGFDSFEGLPEDWRAEFTAGRFKVDRLPSVRASVQLHKGWFEHSVPEFIREHSAAPIAFLHIDCDLYSSTTTVLRGLADRIVAGTVIQFDEYFNYPGWREGEHRAFKQFCDDWNVKVQHLGYVADGEQVAFKIISIRSDHVSTSSGACVVTSEKAAPKHDKAGLQSSLQ